MALPIDGRSISNLIVSTLDATFDQIYDGYFNTNATFERIYQRDRVDEGSHVVFQGGAEIKIPTLYNAPPAVSYSTGTTSLNTETEIVTDLQFQWHQAWCPINISGLKIAQNRGEVELFNLIRLYAEASFNALADLQGTMLYGDGTGNGGLNWDGLLNGVSTAAAGYATYGGITRSLTTGDPGNAINGFVNTTGGVVSKGLLQNAFGSVTFNRDYPDLITLPQAQWSELWERVEANDRNAAGPLRDVGFNTIRFNGAEVVADSKVPANTAWLLNTKYLKMIFLEGRDFVRRSVLSGFGETGFPVFNQDMYVDQLINYGDFAVAGPRYCAQIQNLT